MATQVNLFPDQAHQRLVTYGALAQDTVLWHGKLVDLPPTITVPAKFSPNSTEETIPLVFTEHKFKPDDMITLVAGNPKIPAWAARIVGAIVGAAVKYFIWDSIV